MAVVGETFELAANHLVRLLAQSGFVASEIGIASTAFQQPEVMGLGSIEKILPNDIFGAGILVLPLDLRLSQVEQSMPTNRIIWFAAREDIAPSSVQLVQGEQAVFVEAAYFVLAEGFATRVQLGKRPENLSRCDLAPMLASLAAALALGLKMEILKDYLAPVFVLIAGMGAFLSTKRSRTLQQVSWRLLTGGLSPQSSRIRSALNHAQELQRCHHE